MAKDKLVDVDVGFIEDAITVLLNLVHDEEHAKNSFFMTGDPEWLEIANEARKDRTEMLDKISYHENSQLWCWNKHTLKIIEGYTELANRKYSTGETEEAKSLYEKAKKYLGLFYIKNHIESEGGEENDVSTGNPK
jgi:hypothetical protein